MGIPLFIIFTIALLFELRTYVDRVRPLDPTCAFCRYSLKGLPGQGKCPECGEPYEPLRAVRHVERLVLRKGVLVYWCVTLAALLAFEITGLGRLLYAQGAIQSYLDDGYSFEVATNAAFKRELRIGAASFGQILGGWWFGVSPGIALMVNGWCRYIVLFGVGGLVLSLIFLAGPNP